MTKGKFFNFAIILNLLNFYIFIYCDVIVQQRTDLNEIVPTSESTSACYKTEGESPIYLSLERNNMIGYWPNFLTFRMNLILINPNKYKYLPREQKYILNYHSSGLCAQNYDISDDNIEGITEIAYDACLYLGYFKNRLALFTGSIAMGNNLGMMTFPDNYYLMTMKANVRKRQTPALRSVPFPAETSFNSLFPNHIGKNQRCIVILNYLKTYLMRLNTDVDIRIPYFEQIGAQVINNGHEESFPPFVAYPSICPAASNTSAQNILVAIAYPVPSSEVKWEIVPKDNIPPLAFHDESIKETTLVTFSNEQKISILDQDAPNGINFCSSYRSNAVFLFYTRSISYYCSKIKATAYKLKTVDLSTELETTYRKQIVTPIRHIYQEWETLPICSDC